jgi:hypothetical protein
MLTHRGALVDNGLGTAPRPFVFLIGFGSVDRVDC